MTATGTAQRSTTFASLARDHVTGRRKLARVLSVIAVVAASAAVGIVAGADPARADGGEFVAVSTFGGTGSDQGEGIAVDAVGNTYVTGHFSGTVDFDPGAGTDNRTSNGGTDAFITKLDATGARLWTATIGGTGFEGGTAVDVDAAGNVHVNGYFSGTVDFDPGAGTDNRTSNGGTDAFITKLDATGARLWTATIGGTGIDRGEGIAVDTAGNVHTTGSFQATVDFDPGAGTDNRTSNGSSDVYVNELDPTGAHRSTATFGGTGVDSGQGIAVDTAGNVHTTGSFQATVDFDPGAGTDNRTSSGGSDVYVNELDPTGAHLWVAVAGSAAVVEGGLAVAVDTAGNVYTTGSFSSTVDFDPGAGTANRTSNGDRDAFVTKLDTNGSFQWAATFGGSTVELGSGLAVDSVAVHVIGQFRSGTVDFDPGAGVDNRSSNGSADVFVTRLGLDGTHHWVFAAGGTAFDIGISVAVDNVGGIHATGSFDGTVDFDPGLGTANRTSNGSDDGFVLELAVTCGGLPVTVDIGSGDIPTSGPDVILGTGGPDVINGLGGGDTICGLGGGDTINAGAGNDTVFGGTGNDTIFGSDDNDNIDGEAGTDTIQGNNGNDIIDGGADNDTLSGNDGDDTIGGSAGDDTIFGVAGVDTITGGVGNDTILGGLGNDTISGGDDNDLISGNAGNDQINGNAGDDTLYGVDGDDTIGGDAGKDTVQGGIGADVINGGDDNDALSGNQDNDLVNGGSGDDDVYGVDGNDSLIGGPGVDTVLGGNGDDTISGGGDNDLLSGNAGIDTVNGDAGNDEVYGADGNDTLSGGDGIDVILGGNNNDTINSFDGEADQVSGNAGTDTCTRDPGIDAVFACENLIP